MAWFKGAYRECFCAFCKRPRRVYTKRHLSWTDVGSCGLLTVVGSAGIWRTVSPKAILVMVALVIAGEFIVQLRWRMSLPCAHCGFDPLLYLRNPDHASKQVTRTYEKRRERADFLLTGKALIETQKRIQEAGRARSKVRGKSPLTPAVRAGANLSRTV